jgi:hypothetical protein
MKPARFGVGPDPIQYCVRYSSFHLKSACHRRIVIAFRPQVAVTFAG